MADDPLASHLFSPLTLRGTTFRNRVFASPMCEYSAVDGVPQDWHVVHLGSFARGGGGLVLTEATAVKPEGRISPADTGIWNDAQAEAWHRIVAFIRDQEAVPGIQLAHAGRKASTARPWEGGGHVSPGDGGWDDVVAPSSVAFGTLPAPGELSIDDIAAVVRAFAEAARRADAVGFEVAEAHAAHGYLLHEFLSPLSNRRDDDYGGPFENRVRLLLDVVRAVGAATPAPLVVRLSATGAVGMITEPRQAEDVLASGAADVVLLARAMLRNPHWALAAAHELGVPVGDGVDWPEQYLRATYRD
jgi:2,4-dienoyl-CoA reductase-like NADH-dependent reductase (Old Yellow Enzyme family)